jgi:outer membrane protein
MKIFKPILLILLLSSNHLLAQTKNDSLPGKDDSLLTDATLQNCVQYALLHQPAVQQSLIDQQITEREIKSKLSAWYPQINFGYSYQYYFQLPDTYFEGTFVPQGISNVSNLGLNATQNIFSRDLLLASRTANDVRTQAKQTTASDKIDVTVNVAKAFYDVLLTQKQIELTGEDITRLSRSLKDAYNQYLGGIVDKVDYKQATIALNNSKAEQKQYQESLKTKYAYLKQQMGYPVTGTLGLQYDSIQMQREIYIDTNQTVTFQNRIEYQLLQTQRRLLEENVKYEKWSYIPSLSAFGSYNLAYLNSQFSNLYSTTFPNSYAGLTLAFPIFQGGKRTQDIKTAELQLQRTDFDIISLKNEVNTEYTNAMAEYKSNLVDYYFLKDNLDLATDVYNTIQLQYKVGVKAYLDVITAQTDLRSAEVNYTNALYNVLSSRFDVEKALGTIQY